MIGNVTYILTFYKHKVFVLWAFLFAVVFALQAQTVEENFKAANTFYKKNNFEQAAAAYEKIINQGYRNAEVYYNLGNCYYKLNKTGKSILYYEKALLLEPNDEDLLHNLQLAQLKTVDKPVPVPQLSIIKSYNNFIRLQQSKGWAITALVCVWLAFILFAAYMLWAGNKILSLLGSLFLLGSLVFLLLGGKQYSAEENSCSAVLIVNNVNVKSAPDINGTDIFTIHEGIKFQLLDEVGNWSKIRLIDGKVGWLEKGLFEKI